MKKTNGYQTELFALDDPFCDGAKDRPPQRTGAPNLGKRKEIIDLIFDAKKRATLIKFKVEPERVIDLEPIESRLTDLHAKVDSILSLLQQGQSVVPALDEPPAVGASKKLLKFTDVFEAINCRLSDEVLAFVKEGCFPPLDEYQDQCEEWLRGLFYLDSFGPKRIGYPRRFIYEAWLKVVEFKNIVDLFEVLQVEHLETHEVLYRLTDEVLPDIEQVASLAIKRMIDSLSDISLIESNDDFLIVDGVAFPRYQKKEALAVQVEDLPEPELCKDTRLECLPSLPSDFLELLRIIDQEFMLEVMECFEEDSFPIFDGEKSESCKGWMSQFFYNVLNKENDRLQIIVSSWLEVMDFEKLVLLIEDKQFRSDFVSKEDASSRFTKLLPDGDRVKRLTIGTLTNALPDISSVKVTGSNSVIINGIEFLLEAITAADDSQIQTSTEVDDGNVNLPEIRIPSEAQKEIEILSIIREINGIFLDGIVDSFEDESWQLISACDGFSGFSEAKSIISDLFSFLDDNPLDVIHIVIESWIESIDFEAFTECYDDLIELYRHQSNDNDEEIDETLDVSDEEIDFSDLSDKAYEMLEEILPDKHRVLSAAMKFLVTTERTEVSPEASEESEVKIEMTPSQKQAIEELKEWWASGEKEASLVGPAGTGKTFCLKSLLDALSLSSKDVRLLAPTHKARKILSASIGSGMDASTVAQALGQVPKVDDTGREVFEGGDGKKSSAKLTIVDEASMVNAKSYEELKTLSPRILWVGDKYQLPPVEEKDSKAFSSLSVSVKSELKEVVRYSGAIADFCEFLRQGGRELPDPDNKTIFVLDRKEWIEQALISAKEGLSLSDSNYSKVLSYRNVIADAHNAKIKAHLFPDQKEPFFEGLRLVCSSPIQRLESKSFGRVSKTVWSVKATNSEELLITSTPEKRNLTVDDFDEEPASFYSLVSGLTIWEFRVETEAGLSLLLRVLTPDSDEKRKEMIAHLQGEIDSLKKAGKKATSEQFDALTCLRRFPDNIADTFALTTHKSQGSGYKNVFVDWPDLIKSKDDVKQQLIYTACTRATGRLFITRN